jgi:hypothetical protein
MTGNGLQAHQVVGDLAAVAVQISRTGGAGGAGLIRIWEFS